MKKNITLIVGFLIFIFAASSTFSGGLRPQTSCFIEACEYSAYINRKFGTYLDREVKLAAIVVPAFSPEYMVLLRQVGAEFKIEVFHSENRIENVYLIKEYEHENSLSNKKNAALSNEEYHQLKSVTPDDLDEIKLSKKVASLNAGAAKVLTDYWRQELLKVSYGAGSNLSLDADIFHFFVIVNGRESMAGMAMISGNDARMAGLPGIVPLMTDFASGKIPEKTFLEYVNGHAGANKRR